MLVKKLRKLDWLLIINVVLLAAVGLFVQYSAAGGNLKPWASHQAVIFIVMFFMMLIIALIDISIYWRYAYWAFVLSIVLLFTVNLFGSTAMGATRWINLGVIVLQPSEFIKITTIIALARFFDRINLEKVSNLRILIIPIFMTLIPVLMILKQPNLGTAAIIIMIAAAIFFIAGVKISYFIAIAVIGLTSIPIIWHFLYDYQKKRVLTFLDPDNDPLNSGYNIIQSKIAIGSSGFTGKGFLSGTQTQLKFLPEKHTDFAFTVFAEEMGFTGVIFYFCLYSILIIEGLIIAKKSFKNYFGTLIATGIVALMFIHMAVNIGMIIGLLPVVGVPLPLLSYGGSIMLTSMIGFGLLLNIHVNSHEL